MDGDKQLESDQVEAADQAFLQHQALGNVGSDESRSIAFFAPEPMPWLKRAAENLLDLPLIRHPRIGQATGVFQGIAGEDRDVVELGTELTQTGGDFHVLGQAADGRDGRLGALFRG